MDLNQALLALERSAADVGGYLPQEIDDDTLLVLGDAWLPTSKGSRDSKIRRVKLWLDWCRDAGERWPARELEPDVGQMLIEWVRR